LIISASCWLKLAPEDAEIDFFEKLLLNCF